MIGNMRGRMDIINKIDVTMTKNIDKKTYREAMNIAQNLLLKVKY